MTDHDSSNILFKDPDFNIRGYPSFYQYNRNSKEPLQLWLCDSIIDSVPNRIALSCFGDKVCNIHPDLKLPYEPLMFHVSVVDIVQSGLEAIEDELDNAPDETVRKKAVDDMKALREHLKAALDLVDESLKEASK